MNIENSIANLKHILPSDVPIDMELSEIDPPCGVKVSNEEHVLLFNAGVSVIIRFTHDYVYKGNRNKCKFAEQ
ncbi:MAG: hypothetical protein KUG78_08470 [Kangiellaceae bacterium]|nr:hypothetical protein [Kangiellaceae bacterium]